MKIHLMGVAGSNMLGAAQLALAAGYEITGSDPRDARQRIGHHPGLKALFSGYAAENLTDQALVVTSSLIAPDNPEIIAAEGLGIPIWDRSELMNLLVRRKSRIFSVAGSFGKSSVAAMLVPVIARQFGEPTYFIGAKNRDGTPFVSWSDNAVAVIELCELENRFLNVTATDLIITNVCENHSTFFGQGRARTVKSFRALVAIYADAHQVVVNVADPGTREAGLDRHPKAVTFGNCDAQWHVEPRGLLDDTRWSFEVFHQGRRGGRFSMSWGGARTADNAAAVLASAVSAGMTPKAVMEALAEAKPLGRRFDVLYRSSTLTVIDDHARSAVQIADTLREVRTYRPGWHLIVIAGVWSKLDKCSLEELAGLLSAADSVAIAPSARFEARFGGVQVAFADKLLAELLTAKGITAFTGQFGRGMAGALESSSSGKPTVCLYLGFDESLPDAKMMMGYLIKRDQQRV